MERGPVDEVAQANASFWTGYSQEYLAEHGGILGEERLLWCPEGLTEDVADLLGGVAGRDVLEVGCGAAQGSRWIAANGGRATGIDLSPGMLTAGRAGVAASGLDVTLMEADARSLPLADESFDIAFTAFGAIPFVPDPERIFAEVARVLRPGGRWVFSTSHPMRWVFADDPDPEHLRIVRPYFDREPYLEHDDDGVQVGSAHGSEDTSGRSSADGAHVGSARGPEDTSGRSSADDAHVGSARGPDGAPGRRLAYAEFQHTLTELMDGLLGAGFRIKRILEPEWVDGNDHVWGSWSPDRAPFVPGTLIVSSELG